MSTGKPIVILLVALILFSSVSPLRGESVPRAEIVKLICPSQVPAGKPFTANVTISYSFQGWTLAELGLFENDFNHPTDYVHYYVTSDAVRNFTLTDVASASSTMLHLNVTTRYWFHDFWIKDAKATRDCFVKVLGSGEQLATAPSIVRIGENTWNYWNNSASDALLIWLSGGHAFPDHITVNPYTMESFDVMLFVRDLARAYSVLALRTGSEEHTNPVTNEPYYALGYYPGTIALRELHLWSREHGYNFTYLIGYSTGGMAAAYEVAANDPETWAAPDGAIIIGAPLEGSGPDHLFDSVGHAKNVRADLELLYGGIWSDDLWPQGWKFYESAPNGTKAPWYLKEWHFFPSFSHGIWEQEKDATHYNETAYNITARFIERCKSPFDQVTKWNDGGIEVVDVTIHSSTQDQKPKTPGINFTTDPGDTLQVKLWLYNCTLDHCDKVSASNIRVDLYSSEGYLDSRYTNGDGYEEFTFNVPNGWNNKTVKIFAKIGGDLRDKYTPTVYLSVN